MQPWRSALALFLILPAVFAADFTAMVPAVAVIVIVFLAATNMLATAISNPQMEAWAKTELREFAAGVVLIALIIIFLIGSSGVATALTGDPQYVQTAQGKIDAWTGNLKTAYKDIIEAAGRLRIAASFASGTNIAIYIVSITYQTSPLAGAAIFLVPLSLATQGLTNAIYLSEAIRMLLAYFDVIVPKILLPLSFSVRLIPFTRKLGNTLIALAIAAQVFLPASVILADALNGQIGIPQPRIADMGALDSDPFTAYVFSPLCEFKPFRILFSMTDPLFSLIVCLPVAWIPGAFPACFNMVWQVIYPIMSMIFQWVNAALLIVWEIAIRPDNYGEGVYAQLRPFLTDVTNLTMVIYLDIVFIGLITVSGARSLSAALGGEWYMAGIQRLI